MTDERPGVEWSWGRMTVAIFAGLCLWVVAGMSAWKCWR